MTVIPKTKITQSDIKIYPSERLTDNDDGGGMPLGIPLKGEPNELFNPISSIARVNGGFHVRLTYQGIQRPDDEPFIGSYSAITKPPTDPSVSYLLFPATVFGETRAEVIKRIEAHKVGTIESRMTLLSDQPKNSKIIQAYQRTGEPLPVVGDTYCLRQDKDGYPQHEQYVQVLKVTSERRTFVNKDNKKFKVTVIKMEISSKLETDFIGVEYPVERKAYAPCKIRETHVADASQFYGTKQLAVEIKKQDIKIKVPDLMAQLVPTNQINVPLPDMDIGVRDLIFDSSNPNEKVTKTVNQSFLADSHLYLATSIKIGTLQIESNQNLIEKNGKLFNGDKVIADIDYEEGKFNFKQSVHINKINYQPALYHRQVSDTFSIYVSENNQGYSYSVTLNPKPAEASLTVSYLSQGRWYDLIVDDTGMLRGASDAHGSGNINYATGTVTITCGELPDVGSSIIFAWATKTRYVNRSQNYNTKPYMRIDLAETDNKSVVKKSVHISWQDNAVDKNVYIDSNNKLTGDWKGYYQDDKVYVDIGDDSFNNVASVNVSYSTGERTEIASNDNNTIIASDGTVTLNLGQSINPNTFSLTCLMTTDDPMMADAELEAYLFYDSTRINITDDGNGKLIDEDNVQVGTIDDYVNGICNFNVNRQGKLGYNVFGTYNSSNEEYKYKTGTDSKTVDIRIDSVTDIYCYSADNQSNVNTEVSLTDTKLFIQLPRPQQNEKIAKGSVCFYYQGKFYYERDGDIYHEYNQLSNLITANGSIDYSTGEVLIDGWQYLDKQPLIINSLATYTPYHPIENVRFRVPKIPLANASLQIRAVNMKGQMVSATAKLNGDIQDDDWGNGESDIVGFVDVNSGLVSVHFNEMVQAESIIYNAVARSYLPIDSSIVKIDTVRLPPDGRVPIYRGGDTILIANSQEEDIGSVHLPGSLKIVRVSQCLLNCGTMI